MKFRIGQYIKCYCNLDECPKGYIVCVQDEINKVRGYYVRDSRRTKPRFILKTDARLVVGKDKFIAYNAQNLPNLLKENDEK